jgi:hypothetical protein
MNMDYQRDFRGAPAPNRSALPRHTELRAKMKANQDEPATSHRKGRVIMKYIVGFFIMIVIITGGFATWRHFSQPPNPIPTDILHSVNFPVYYPSRLASGFYVDQNSIKINGNLLFYVVSDGSMNITIVEQSLPPYLPPPNFKVLSSFETAAGSASTGTSNGSPVAIVKTSKTLINIGAPKQTPANIFYDLIKNMTY